MRKYKFACFLGIYALVLIGVAVIGLSVLWKFLSCYEASLPDRAVSAYETVMESEFQDYLEQYAAAHATALQSKEEVLSYVRTQVDTSTLNLRKDGDAYLIRLGKEPVGRLPLVYTPMPGTNFGFQACSTGQAQWEWQAEFASQWRITAPAEADISVNGQRLNGRNTSLREAPGTDESLYRELEPVKALEYSFRYYGEPKLQIAEDAALEFTAEQQENAFTVAAFFKEDATPELRSVAESFVGSYIAYTSHANGYAVVLPYLVIGSDLARRIIGSLDGMQWVEGVTSTISNLSTDHFAPYGDAVVCEAHYDLTDIMGGVRNCNMRMVLEKINGSWKVRNIEMF